MSLVAAVASNGVIGRDNDLVCRFPEDQRHFRAVTLGHPVLMGRRTWDSLPPRFRPLPGRRNLVLTRQPGWSADGAERVADIEEALSRCAGAERLCVIGGAEVYAQALPHADELDLTEIEREIEGDVRFPDWPRARFVEVSRERHRAAAPHDFDFSFVTYRRT
ncbi:MAG: dihydrofolate reductase [Rubrivivax sp.]